MCVWGFGNKEGGEMAIGVGGAVHHADQRVRREDIRVVVWRDRGGGVTRTCVGGQDCAKIYSGGINTRMFE